MADQMPAGPSTRVKPRMQALKSEGPKIEPTGRMSYVKLSGRRYYWVLTDAESTART